MELIGLLAAAVIGLPITLAVYLYIVGVTAGMRIFPRPKSKNDMENTSFYVAEGVLWPVFLPVVAICLLFYCWIIAATWVAVKTTGKGLELGEMLGYNFLPDKKS